MMKSKVKALFVVVIVLLAAANSYFIYKFREVKQNAEIYAESVKPYITEYNILKNNLLYTIDNKAVLNVSDRVLIDGNKIEQTLGRIVGERHGEVLFCRLGEGHCPNCKNYVVFLAKNLRNADVVFLTNDASHRNFVNCISTYHLEDCEVMACENLGIRAEELSVPYFFTVDSLGYLTQVYLPEQNHEELDFEMLGVMTNKQSLEYNRK